MIEIKRLFLLLVLTIFFDCNSHINEEESALNTKNQLFTFLSAQQTGIDFQNTLTEALNTNILMYEYFYNGGGVAAGDLNGDQLVDLYFTSNMSDNKLYINKGNMKFEDITLTCGAEGRPGPWKTGVTMVDINGDGRLDIYICHSGALPDEKRKNELFINTGNNPEGNPRFKESAAEYGLDSPAFSTQAYFFDYDLDGDLDMILLNHNPKNLPMLNKESTAELFKQNDELRGTRLYQNNNGKFDDVTIKAGINGSPLSYGLGIGISDLNDDGWPDFYVSNDYNVPDYIYINNKNATFTNKLSESLDHTSQFSMGNDIADVNNDGRPDILTLDMLPEDNHRQKLLLAPDNYNKFDLNVRSGFYYQNMRNMLQLNNGDGTFSEIGQLAGISSTDWSWSALFADFNDDGYKDLHITNGYKRDYTNLDFINYMDDYVKTKGRLVREDVMQIIEQMPASNISNYIFEGTGGIAFKNKTLEWGLERPSNSNGAIYADLDNDGDQDLVINNINQTAFIYQNESNKNPGHHYLQIKLMGTAPNTMGIGAKIQLFSKDKRQVGEQFLERGYQSSVSPVMHFGLGDEAQVDSVKIIWPDRRIQSFFEIHSNQLLTCNQSEATKSKQPPVSIPNLFNPINSPINFEHHQIDINDFDRQYLLPSKMSYSGPCMSQGDLNRDGLDDIVFGGSLGQAPAIYLQTRNGTFARSLNTFLEKLTHFEGSHPLIFDANNDGWNDILIPSCGYHDYGAQDTSIQPVLLMNDGKNNFVPKLQSIPIVGTCISSAVAIDINSDGYQDLFMGGRLVPGRYPESPNSYVLINDGKGNFTDNTSIINSSIEKLGMVTDALAIDINNDKIKDLVVVGEWMPVTVFVNQKGRLVNKTNEYFDKLFIGWWNVIHSTDLNNDGKPDLVIGNHGLNSPLKASETTPLELYVKDFDRNGSIDPLMTAYIQDKSYPFITRDELVKQLAYLKPKYNSFKSYADATITDIFKKEDLQDAQKLMANHLETSLFLSGSDGKFHYDSLPIEAQLSPVYCITTMDIDKDGKQDLILTGNNRNFKIRIGQMDANHGVLLKNAGNGKFETMDQESTGLKIRGDVRSSLTFDNKILFALNNQKILTYQLMK